MSPFESFHSLFSFSLVALVLCRLFFVVRKHLKQEKMLLWGEEHQHEFPTNNFYLQMSFYANDKDYYDQYVGSLAEMRMKLKTDSLQVGHLLYIVQALDLGAQVDFEAIPKFNECKKIPLFKRHKLKNKDVVIELLVITVFLYLMF